MSQSQNLATKCDIETPITNASLGEIENKKKEKKKKTTKSSKSKETKLDCEHCPLFKLYKLDKFVDGEGTSTTRQRATYRLQAFFFVFSHARADFSVTEPPTCLIVAFGHSCLCSCLRLSKSLVIPL
jgi:hypothetical protein